MTEVISCKTYLRLPRCSSGENPLYVCCIWLVCRLAMGCWSNKEPNWKLCGVMTHCVGILYVYKMIYVYMCVASYNDMVLKKI